VLQPNQHTQLETATNFSSFMLKTFSYASMHQRWFKLNCWR